MKRKEKIRLLQAIKTGKMSIEELTPTSGGIFIQISTDPSVYEGKGRTYTETELNKYLSQLNCTVRYIILTIDTDCEPIKDWRYNCE